MTCIIIEDEPLARERLVDYIEKIPGFKLLSVFNNAIDALTFLQNYATDVIFLDIHMAGMSGINLLEQHKIQGQVILTTAYHEFAVKGFELNVTDYLLKPFSFERFQQGVEKAQIIHSRDKSVNTGKYFFVRTEYHLEKIMYDELLFVEGMRDYRRIHTLTKPIMTLQTFREFEAQIPVNILFRVHKSYMVAIDKIDAIVKNSISIKGKIIPVSETYKHAFLNLINQSKDK
jgi:DNA-binding LytR/AlgR family response regulator